MPPDPMNAASVPGQRSAGREHFPVPVHPKSWYWMRLAQLLGGVLCMSLAIYAQTDRTRSKAGPLTIVTVGLEYTFPPLLDPAYV